MTANQRMRAYLKKNNEVIIKKTTDLICPKCGAWAVLYPGTHRKEETKCHECSGRYIDFMPPSLARKELKRIRSIKTVPIMKRFVRKGDTLCAAALSLVESLR